MVSEDSEVFIKTSRGEGKDDELYADIRAAVEAESEAIETDFWAESITKVVLITIKAAVPAIVQAVQKQLASAMGSHTVNKNILQSKFKEDELEQYTRKENVRIIGIEEENSGDETEEKLVEKVCNLAKRSGGRYGQRGTYLQYTDWVEGGSKERSEQSSYAS